MKKHMKKSLKVKYSNPKSDDLKVMFSIKEISDLKNKINSINLYNIQSTHLMDDLANQVDSLSKSVKELKDECTVYDSLNQYNPLIFSS